MKHFECRRMRIVASNAAWILFDMLLFSLPWKGECIIDLHLETSHKPRMELGQHEGAMGVVCLVESYSENRVSFALTQF